MCLVYKIGLKKKIRKIQSSFLGWLLPFTASAPSQVQLGSCSFIVNLGWSTHSWSECIKSKANLVQRLKLIDLYIQHTVTERFGLCLHSKHRNLSFSELNCPPYLPALFLFPLWYEEKKMLLPFTSSIHVFLTLVFLAD